MSNEWKELKIDNLESDFITGSYELQYLENFNTTEYWKDVSIKNRNICGILENQMNGSVVYRYRKPEPKQHTHEEIMTKWFLYKDGRWRKCKGYKEGIYEFGVYTHRKDYFAGMRFEDIPPEDK